MLKQSVIELMKLVKCLHGRKLTFVASNDKMERRISSSDQGE